MRLHPAVDAAQRPRLPTTPHPAARFCMARSTPSVRQRAPPPRVWPIHTLPANQPASRPSSHPPPPCSLLHGQVDSLGQAAHHPCGDGQFHVEQRLQRLCHNLDRLNHRPAAGWVWGVGCAGRVWGVSVWVGGWVSGWVAGWVEGGSAAGGEPLHLLGSQQARAQGSSRQAAGKQAGHRRQAAGRQQQPGWQQHGRLHPTALKQPAGRPAGRQAAGSAHREPPARCLETRVQSSADRMRSIQPPSMLIWPCRHSTAAMQCNQAGRLIGGSTVRHPAGPSA